MKELLRLFSAEVFAFRTRDGLVVTLIKAGDAAEGITNLREGQVSLMHVRD